MNVTLLCGNTLRARAYAQQLIQIPSLNISGVFYGFEETNIKLPIIEDATASFCIQNELLVPDYSTTPLETAETHGWSMASFLSKDVNDPELITLVLSTKPDLVIYAGYGGQILAPSHFENGINYLHMHPGNIPTERGSTTMYYSILNKRKCTVSAFFMNAQIDAGGIIIKKSYTIPTKGVDMDQYYDNIIRSNCMAEALNKIVDGNYELEFPDYSTSIEYYVIHPLLKHLAILSLPERTEK